MQALRIVQYIVTGNRPGEKQVTRSHISFPIMHFFISALTTLLLYKTALAGKDSIFPDLRDEKCYDLRLIDAKPVDIAHIKLMRYEINTLLCCPLLGNSLDPASAINSPGYEQRRNLLFPKSDKKAKRDKLECIFCM